MADLKATAEALLQTAQVHQHNFEVIAGELQERRRSFEEHQRRMEELRQSQIESDQRFEIMLSEFRQLKIESDNRFNETSAVLRGLQAENRRILDRLLNPNNPPDEPA